MHSALHVFAQSPHVTHFALSSRIRTGAFAASSPNSAPAGQTVLQKSRPRIAAATASATNETPATPNADQPRTKISLFKMHGHPHFMQRSATALAHTAANGSKRCVAILP